MCFVPRVADKVPHALLDRRLWSSSGLRCLGVSNAPKPFILEVLLPRVTDQVPHVDESGIASLEGKLPNYTIHYHSYKIIKEYFEPKYNVTKCQ